VLSYAELQSITDDIARRLTKRKVQKVRMLSPHTIGLELYGFDQVKGETSKRWLLLSMHRKHGRLHTLSDAPTQPPFAHPFADQLKKHLKGAGFVSISLLNDERVIEMHFESKSGYPILIQELLGTRTNCFLLDEKRNILGSLHAIPASRELAQGAAWHRPEASGLPERALQNRFEGIQEEELHNAVESEYQDQEMGDQAEGLRASLKRALKREVDFIERKMKKIDEDLQEQSRYQEFRRYGDLIKAYLPNLKPEKGEVTVVDYDEDGNPVDVTIPIDESMTVQQNMELYFKKFRKGAKGSQKLGTHLNVLLSARNDARTWLKQAEILDDDALKEFAERPEIKRMLAKHEQHLVAEEEREHLITGNLASTRHINHADVKLRPRRMQSVDGWEILVGKGAAGNDHLTIQIANGNDTFLHVDGVPGSHVIIPEQKGQTPPLETLLDAAQLAMHFSKMKNASKANVSYTQKKYVKKPKGAKPGLVVLNQRKSLSVRKDESRLNRLLGKQPEAS